MTTAHCNRARCSLHPLAARCTRSPHAAPARRTLAAGMLALATLAFGLLAKVLLAKVVGGVRLASTVETPRLALGLLVGLFIARMV